MPLVYRPSPRVCTICVLVGSLGQGTRGVQLRNQSREMEKLPGRYSVVNHSCSSSEWALRNLALMPYSWFDSFKIISLFCFLMEARFRNRSIEFCVTRQESVGFPPGCALRSSSPIDSFTFGLRTSTYPLALSSCHLQHVPGKDVPSWS